MEFLQGIQDAIKNLGASIVNGFIDGLKALFIPRDNYFNDKISNLYTKLTDKLPFIEDIKILFESLFQTIFNADDNVPIFNFTYKGVSMNIFDFSLYQKYRGLIHGVMIFVSYFFFVRRLFKRLPGLIGGF